MIELVGFLLAAATFAFIAYPLFFHKPQPAPSVGNDRLQELYSKRDTTYSMLKELEFDYNSGILTEEDYKDLDARYKNKAISVLKGIDDQVKTSGDIEAEIEKQVKKLRHGKRAVADMDAEIESQIQALRKNRGQFCPQCGAKSRDGDRFCRHCGTKLD